MTLNPSSGILSSSNKTDANCGQSDGSMTVIWTGGNGPFSISGSVSQNNATSPHTFSNLPSGSYTVTITDANGCTSSTAAIIGNGTGPAVSASAQTATCGLSNGSVAVSWTDGVGPFTISGDLVQNNATNPTIFNNLAAGSYNVTLTDANGCSSVALAVVSNTTNPQISATINNASCGQDNGNITIVWTNGTGPFNISGDLNQAGASSPTFFFNLSQGTYNVTVTDFHGCASSTICVISNSTGPTATVTSSNATCGLNNGIVNIVWSGGVGPFTITGDLNRSNATSPAIFSVLSAGTYNFSLTDANNCTSFHTVTLTNTISPTATSTQTDANCGQSNGAMIVTWSGGVGPFNITGDLTQNNASSPFTFTGLSSGSYTVVISDVNGCSSTTTAIVGNGSGPVVTSSAQPTTCGMDNGAVTVQWTGGVGPFSISGSLVQVNATNPTVFTNLPSGSYSTILTDSNGCTSIATSTVINVGSPQISTTVNNASCGQNNGSVTVIWSNGAAPFNISGDLSQSGASSPALFNNLSAGAYNIIVTDKNGCTASSIATVLNNQGPIVSVNKKNGSCGLNNGEISIAWTGGVGPFTITGDINRNNATSPAVFPLLIAGTYSFTIKDANNCSSVQSVTITNTTPPIAMATKTDANCGQSNGSLVVAWTGGTAPFIVSGDLSQNNATSPHTFSNLSSGSYTVVITDSHGCSASASASIGNGSGPVVSASVAPETCGKRNGSVTITWTGGVSPFNISGDLVRNNASSPTTFNNLSAGKYNITLTDATGCTSIASPTVTNAAGLTGTTIKQDATCGLSNGNVVITWSGGVAPFNLKGSFDRPNISSPAAVDNLSPGTYTFEVFDANGCSAVSTVTINNVPGVTMQCDAKSESAQNANDGSIVLTFANGVSPYSVVWSGTASGSMNGISTATFNISNLGDGTYNIIVTDANGCTADCESIIASPDCKMTADVKGEITKCFGSNDGVITLQISEPVGNVKIVWSNAAWNGMTNITNAAAGTYRVTITDEANCIVTDNVIIGQPSQLSVNCNGNSVSEHGNTDGIGIIGIQGGTANYAISWSGTQSGLLSNVPSGNSSIPGLSVGAYSVTVTDNNGCHDECSFSIGDVPCTLSISTKIIQPKCFDTCDGDITLTVAGTSANYQISWSDSSFGNVDHITELCEGNYSVTVTDTNGCTSSSSNIIIVNPEKIDVKIMASNVLPYINEIVNLSLETNVPSSLIDSIFWVNDQLSCHNCAAPTIQVIKDENVNVVIMDKNGCVASDDIVLRVKRLNVVDFPNIIATNSNSGNDKFFPIGKKDNIKSVKSLSIYDRWGNLVFYKENMDVNAPDQGWNASYNAQPVEQGVYVYVAYVDFIDGTSEVFMGDVTVIR